jgi:hypothetical protein
MSTSINISGLRSYDDGEYSVVSAQVEDLEVWFRSAEDKMRPTPEAFASAMIVPAMHLGRDLAIEGEVCPLWFDNIQEIMKIFSMWWKYDPVAIHHDGFRIEPGDTGTRTGLVFSGGVDSFYSLMRYPGKIDDIIFIQGFEIAQRNPDRQAAFEAMIKRTAKATGTRPVMLETNFREHPLFETPYFGDTHGGLLAAAGHVLFGLDTLVISSSFPVYYSKPWGSHFDTDKFFSSREVTMEHFGQKMWRTEKLLDIAGERVVQENLAVCFENFESTSHCGYCEKCLRTEIILTISGQLEKFKNFHFEEPVAYRISKIRRGFVKPYLASSFKGFLGKGLDQATEKAIRGYIKRVYWHYNPVRNGLRNLERNIRHHIQGR